MESRFGVLRFISVLYKLFGILVLVLAIFIAVVSALTSLGYVSLSPSGGGYSIAGIGIIGAIVQFIVGMIAAIGLYAFGELIELFISTERNTRTMAILMERLLKQQNNLDYK